MRRILAAALLLLPSLLRADGSAVTLFCPEELHEAWMRIVEAHPLPDGCQAVAPLPCSAYGPQLIIVRRGTGSGGRVVDRVLLAPVGRLAGAAPAPSRVAPLESIRLPDIALPVEGLTADQPGYPLQEEVSLEIAGGSDELRAWLDELPPAPERAPSALITWIGAVGDIMPARGVDAALLSRDGLQDVFSDTLPVLQSCDFLAGNLEAAATTRGAAANKTYTFRFRAEALRELARAGFSYLSVANNHAFDFGARGFLDTLEALRHVGMGTSGAGADEQQAAAPFEALAGGLGIRVLSFSAYPADRRGFDGRVSARARPGVPGALWLDERGLAAAAAAFSRGSFNIAMVHGGEEWTALPTEAQKRLYRALVDAGADLVIGSHPHVLQPMEARQGRLIAYSLGNFLFPGMEGTPGGQESMIVRVGVMNGAIRCVEMYPVRLEGGSVSLAPR